VAFETPRTWPANGTARLDRWQPSAANRFLRLCLHGRGSQAVRLLALIGGTGRLPAQSVLGVPGLVCPLPPSPPPPSPLRTLLLFQKHAPQRLRGRLETMGRASPACPSASAAPPQPTPFLPSNSPRPVRYVPSRARLQCSRSSGTTETPRSTRLGGVHAAAQHAEHPECLPVERSTRRLGAVSSAMRRVDRAVPSLAPSIARRLREPILAQESRDSRQPSLPCFHVCRPPLITAIRIIVVKQSAWVGANLEQTANAVAFCEISPRTRTQKQKKKRRR